MKKPHEQEWSAKQTSQGVWVHGDGKEAVAFVYNPMADKVGGSDLEERVANSEALALARAEVMAAAPDMARALLGVGHLDNGEWHLTVCWQHHDACPTQCLAARAALRKAGVL